MPELQPQDTENLKHMLGADSRYMKKDWGFRNRFSAGGDDITSMERLEKNELVRKIAHTLYGDHLYVATEKGCKHLGFNKKQIANALDF
jgi:hypothetical protein